MSEAREEILARIRHANQVAAATEMVVPRDYHRAGPYGAGAPELLDLFTERLIDYRATVHRVMAEELPDRLASIVDGWRLVTAHGVPKEWGNWERDSASLAAADLDRVDGVLTACAAAAAQTGTIVLDASSDQGRRALTLVPDKHVCVVRADQVVWGIPELLARLDPKRPLTFISGPSATSDIELQRVEGVHGPRTLIVVLVTAPSQ